MGRIKESKIFNDIKINLREIWYLIGSNKKLIIPFLLVFSIVNIVFTSVLFEYGIDVAMIIHNVTYLSPENYLGFLGSYKTIIIALIVLILLSLLFVFGVSSIMHAYTTSAIGKKTSIRGMVFSGIKTCKKSLLFKNWLIIIYIFLVAPLTGVFALCFSSFSIAVPEFIRDAIFANSLYKTLYILIYIFLLFLESIYLYSINYYILSNCTFVEACKKSRKIIKKNYLVNIVTIIIVVFIFRTVVLSASSIISTYIAKIYQLFTGSSENAFLSKMISVIPGLCDFLEAILEPGVNIATVTVLFFRSVEDNSELASLSKETFNDDTYSKSSLIVIGIVLSIVFGILISTIVQQTIEDRDILDVPDIVAHRGDSVNAPENTIPAFELALAENPDWIELDVHQTKDGVIVVSHDDDLSRVTGKKVFVHELTFDELQKLDAGSWFSNEYSYVRIAKLDDILKIFKDKINVQIEVKYTGFDDHLEEHVLEVVNNNNMHDQVIFTSLQSEPLKRLKEIDPSVTVVYSMYVAVDHIEEIEFADWFTVEESNINEELVNNVHKAGKKIFTWTCNTEEGVQHLIDCRVDGILTDNPNMMKNAYLFARYNSGFPKRIRLLIDLLSKGINK